MSVLVIRAHKRFGVCREIRLLNEGGAMATGLLIEISLEGCRISSVAEDVFEVEDSVQVEIDGWASFEGRVRWQHDGLVGLRLTRPLHNGELAKLLEFCRGEEELKAARRA